MLFKHKHLLDDLRERGRTAPAEIISVKTVGGGNHLRAMWASDQDLTAQWMDCWMHLRVLPKNRAEPPFEATVLTRMHTLPLEGGVVPVWYDPADHARVVVDYEADVQGKMHSLAHGDLLQHRYDQRLGLAWTPVRDALLPVMVMAERGRGRVKATGLLAGLFGPAAAESAVAAVRGAAPQLLPQLGADWFAHHDLTVEEPYGDIPRDTTPEDAAGAGLAIAVALVSLLGGHLVHAEVAVTGRLTADGRLEPVTDLHGRATAAHHVYATRLVAPAGNATDRGHTLQGLEFTFAAGLDEAVRACLARHALRTFVPPA